MISIVGAALVLLLIPASGCELKAVNGNAERPVVVMRMDDVQDYAFGDEELLFLMIASRIVFL